MEANRIDNDDLSVEIKEEYEDEDLEFQDLHNLNTNIVENLQKKIQNEDSSSQPNAFNWKSFKWTCYFCNSTRSDYEALRKHLQTVHHIMITANIFYKHDECTEIFSDYALFLNHMKSQHFPQLRLCCDVCNRNDFSDFATFAIHRENHLSKTWHPNVYACNQCEMNFSLKPELENHLKLKHTIENGKIGMERECRICHKMIQAGAMFYMHLKTHTSFVLNNGPSTSKSACENEKVVKFSAEPFEQMVTSTVPTKNSLNNFLCQVCELRLDTVDLLALHMKVHTDGFKHSYGKNLFHKILLSHKTKIINEQNKFKNSTDSCWVNLSVFIGQFKTPQEIYEYIKQNVADIKNKLLNNISEEYVATTKESHISDKPVSFIVRVAANDFNDLLEKSAEEKETLKLNPDLWKNFFADIYKERSLNCIYNFTTNYINSKSGFITGHCECGCKMNICIIEEELDIIALRCVILDTQKKKQNENYQCKICFVDLETLDMFETHQQFHINTAQNSSVDECSLTFSKNSNPQENSLDLNNQFLNDLILKYKNKLTYRKEGGFLKILKSSDPIWFDLSEAAGKIKTPLALYAYVTSNKNGVRTFLEKECQVNSVDQSNADETLLKSSLEKNEENSNESFQPQENLLMEMTSELFSDLEEKEKLQKPEITQHKKGPKSQINNLLLNKTILKFKNKITYYDNGIMKIVSKLNTIWLDLSKATGKIKTPQALYAYVTCNKHKIRDLLEAETIDESNSPNRNIIHRRTIDPKYLNKIILQYKDKLTFIESQKIKITSISDPIWKKISEEIGEIKAPNAIYKYVTNNDYNIRQILVSSVENQSNDKSIDPAIQTCDLLNLSPLSNGKFLWEKTLLRFKEKLTYLEDGILKLKSKSDVIWNELAEAMPISKTPLAVYLHVFNNKKLRDLLEITLPEPPPKYFNNRLNYYKEIMNEKILEYKEKISYEENGIQIFKNKADPIWQEISNSIKNVKNPIEIYNYATNISSTEKVNNNSNSSLRTSKRFEKSEKTHSIPKNYDVPENVLNQEKTRFVILVERNEFVNLFQQGVWKCTKDNKKRHIIKMKAGLWTYFLTSKIFESQRQKCGYSFSSHHISPDLTFGIIKGYCHCGSNLKVFIHKNDDDLYGIYCETTKGQEGKQCKKVYIRGPVREIIAKQLMNSSVSEFYEKSEKELQIVKDVDEPALLIKPRTLHVIRSEFKNRMNGDNMKREYSKQNTEEQNCEPTLPRKRGKRSRNTIEEIKEIFLPFINQLTYNKNGEVKLKSSSNPVWNELAENDNAKVNSSTFYSYACNNHEIRAMLGLSETIYASDGDVSESDFSGIDSEEESLNFSIRVPYEEYSKMLTTSKCKLKKTAFIPGLWTHFLNTKIWETNDIVKCGFSFKSHQLNRNGKSGQAFGYCKCGATLNCVFLEDRNDSTIMVISCKIIKGDENKSCGKIVLRNPIRQQIGKELQHRSVADYRKEQLNKLMQINNDGDNNNNKETSFLMHHISDATLYQVKSEYRQRKIDDDVDNTRIKKIVKRRRFKKEKPVDQIKKCTNCDLYFNSDKLLADHIKTHNPPEAKAETTEYIPLKRGRKPKCEAQIMQAQILKFTDQICFRNNERQLKFKSKNDPIWVEISKAINEVRPPHSLYAYVMQNVHGIRKLIENAWSEKAFDKHSQATQTLENATDIYNENMADNRNAVPIPGSSQNNYNNAELDAVSKTNEDFLFEMFSPTENST